ncbi:MAG TPA: molybdopterin-dependent oxidoreductase [Bacteroidota bacterium]|nr:molybdopterin-dependent oxidoreductase [Bacteroidota bacterium]
MEIRRREFLRLFGGLAGAAAVSGCALEEVFEMPSRLIEQARRGPGIETWKNTICGLCSAGCGIRVRLVDGLPVYVKGNPMYPINQGGLCPLGLNALHHLYHPDRLKGPMKQVGKFGSGKWESITWDEALKTVSDALVKLRNEGNPHQVAFLGHDERGLMHRHIARFMQAYGSPNYFQFSPAQDDGVAYLLMQGDPQIPAYDVLNAKLIVSFGSNFLEEGHSPIYYTKLYGHHQDSQTRYVQIESRMSLTASNADRWVTIRPGAYGALALGIAYVLLREELYDTEFVNAHTFGFEDWTDRSGTKHLGFKSFVLGNYYPERVAELTGVPSATILELARELGNTRPALVIGGQGAVNNTNGTYSLMAVQSLNALLGNFERAGGLYSIDEPPFGALPVVQRDPTGEAGNGRASVARSQDGSFPLAPFSMKTLTKNILEDQPYPVGVLFLYGGNALFETVDHIDFAKVLQKIPLVVSFDSIRTETSEYAHLILPDHTFFETWDEVSNVPSVGFTHIGIQQPVVAPLFETRHTGDVLIDLAKRIGGSVAASFAFESYQEEMKQGMNGVYESGEGAILSASIKGKWLQYLQQRGWQIGRYSSFDEFWAQLLEHGGWWNPIRKQKPWEKVFHTPSGKFEFYSQRLKSTFDALVKTTGDQQSPQDLELVLSRLNISARGDTTFLPHHEPVPFEPDLPMHLVTFQPLAIRNGNGAHLPMMQEMFGYTVGRYWDSWVEIHPKTASDYGIADGQWIWLESSVASLRVRAKITPGILLNVVAVPFGLGHSSCGRYARGHGTNPYSIMRNTYDLLSGKPALEVTKVKISVAA